MEKWFWQTIRRICFEWRQWIISQWIINGGVIGRWLLSRKKVVFRLKSVYQKDDCINRSAEYDCPNKSVLEVVCGNAAVRCCEDEKCMERADEIARTIASL